MKAPDKIYLREFKEDGLSQVWSSIKPMEETIIASPEYIRKDALLEWLEGKMTAEGATEGIVGGYDFALKDVIKHIKSL